MTSKLFCQRVIYLEVAYYQPSKRYVDLDWIRVLATLAVFTYHCSMFFNPFPWHVKNNVINTSYVLVYSLFVGAWIMPVFFAISGIATFHALKKRNGASYIKERFLRLGIPLLFGVFILSPPQVYVERVTHHQFKGSLWAFLPHYFDGVYLDIGGPGNFAFVGLHLWYLLVLLIFSILTLPLFLKIRKTNVNTFKVSTFLLLPLPLIVVTAFLNLVNLGGWGLPFYLLIYLYGYYFFSNEAFRVFLRQFGPFIGLVALVCSIIYIAWFMIALPMTVSLLSLIFTIVRVMTCWTWVLFIFYLGDEYLVSSNRFLQYGNRGSMPFYVLHQPVIVFLGFAIYDLHWAVPLKILFLVPTAFAMIMIVYHFLIQKVEPLQVLFGIKKSPKPAIINPETRVKA